MSLMLGEFDVKNILDCLDKELSKEEQTVCGPVLEKDQNGYNYQAYYQYRGITKRGKQIQRAIKHIKSQIQ